MGSLTNLQMTTTMAMRTMTRIMVMTKMTSTMMKPLTHQEDGIPPLVVTDAKMILLVTLTMDIKSYETVVRTITHPGTTPPEAITLESQTADHHLPSGTKLCRINQPKKYADLEVTTISSDPWDNLVTVRLGPWTKLSILQRRDTSLETPFEF